VIHEPEGVAVRVELATRQARPFHYAGEG
jgi:hypothetical protein